MRYSVAFGSVLVVCVVAIAAVACGGEEEPRIPCEYASDCPTPDDECLHASCIAGFCRYFADQHGAGCELSDGSIGVCDPPDTFSPDTPGCVKTSEPIPCVYGLNNTSKYYDGTLCRVPDGREGTCLDGVCGGEHFCEGVVCDEPDNLCGSDQFCNWEGVCEFRQVTQCPSDGSTCTFDECDPDKGCVYIQRPNGADCFAGDWFCCLLTAGLGECCDPGTCRDGVCVPD